LLRRKNVLKFGIYKSGFGSRIFFMRGKVT